MQLSPLNISGLKVRHGMRSTPSVPRRIEVVTRYRCPECGGLHEWEDDAKDCCKKFEAESIQANCPVCGEEFETHRDAADCCLWKDIDALTRWAIADAVEDGGEWLSEITKHTGKERL